MNENFKIQLMIDILKSQLEKTEDKESIVYATLKITCELAESIKEKTTILN